MSPRTKKDSEKGTPAAPHSLSHCLRCSLSSPMSACGMGISLRLVAVFGALR